MSLTRRDAIKTAAAAIAGAAVQVVAKSCRKVKFGDHGIDNGGVRQLTGYMYNVRVESGKLVAHVRLDEWTARTGDLVLCQVNKT